MIKYVVTICAEEEGKMKKVLLPISLIILVFLGVFAGWLLMAKDREGPVIEVDMPSAQTWHSDMDRNELLEHIRATDERDGDVTDSLIVESVKSSDTEDSVTITVVAMDRSHNVTKSSWEMKRDTSANGETVQPVEGAGDETDPGQEDAGLQEGGEETTEETENSDPEEQAVAAREEQIAALSDEAPRFYLKQHQVTVEKNGEFDRLSWVEEISDDADDRNSLFRNIQVEGEVDVSAEGTYELTYFVVDSDGNRSNEEVMTVTVTA